MNNGTWKKTGEFHGEIYKRQQKASNGGGPLILILIFLFLALVTSSRDKPTVEESDKQKPFTKSKPHKEAEVEKERYKALAKQEYKIACDAHKNGDYNSALYHVNNAVEYNPGNLWYKVYRDQIKADERADRHIRKACGWIGEKLGQLKDKLER